MKKIAETFRSARKIEIVLVAVMIAVMAVIMLGQNDVPASSSGSAEYRLKSLLSGIKGAGRVDVMLTGDENSYTGCVVIAEGARDMRVVLKMQRAIQAALDISPENIEIIASGG